MSEQQGLTKPDLWQQIDEDNYTLRLDISPKAHASAIVTRIATTPESWLAHVNCPGGSHASLCHDCKNPLKRAKQWCETTIIQNAAQTVEDWAKVFFALSGEDDGVQALAAELRGVTFSAQLIAQIRDIAAQAKAGGE